MRTRSQLLVAGLAAAVLLSLAVTSAPAGKLSISNQRWRAVWLSYGLDSAGGLQVECPITMEGSFHSGTIRKVVGALMGYISRAMAASGACTGGTASVNQESLPWHDTYCGFEGTLPAITGLCINLFGEKFTINSGGTLCTMQSERAHPARVTAAIGTGGRVGRSDPIRPPSYHSEADSCVALSAKGSSPATPSR